MQQPVARVLALWLGLIGIFAIVLTFADPGTRAEASTPRKPTLLEFIRAGAAVHPSVARPVRSRATFRQVGSAWGDVRQANKYLLYASDVTAAGVGSVKVFPGWISGPNPPVIGQIDGLDNPADLAIDRFGTLYVVQADQNAPVLVFPFLSTTPSLQLSTEGFPVSIAVSNDGTVFVGTARVYTPPTVLPEILVYPPGSTTPALHLADLAGDAVGSVRVNAENHIFFGVDDIGYGNSLNEIEPWSQPVIVQLPGPPGGLDLDRSDNLVSYTTYPTVQVFSRTGASLRTIDTKGFQSLTLGSHGTSLYTAAGTIYKNAYPSGAASDTITTLASDNTFGLATYPAAPLPR